MKKLLIPVAASVLAVSVICTACVRKINTEGLEFTSGTAQPDAVTVLFEPSTAEETRLADKIASIFEKTTEALTEEPTTAPVNYIEDYEYAYAGFQPAYANLDIEDWKLLLVNRDYILPDGYEVELAPSITDDSDSMKLDYRVAPHYNEMYLAALEDGIELTPVSGYRSVERQERNFKNKIQKYVDEGYSKTEATQMAATIILPPGTSEHNAGLAMDICSLYESFENTDEFAWLSENAADYGFILRYPEDKQDITKIIYEPWHWRYVGVEAAKEMKASGQCFEEYLGVVNN